MGGDEEMRELTEIAVTRVDLVDSPANRRKFSLFKSEDGDTDAAAKAKADADAAAAKEVADAKVKTDADAAAAKTKADADAEAAKVKTGATDLQKSATVQAELVAKLVKDSLKEELAKLPAFQKAEADSKAEKYSAALKLITDGLSMLKSLTSKDASVTKDVKPAAEKPVKKDEDDKKDGEDVSEEVVKELEKAEKAVADQTAAIEEIGNAK